MSFLANGITAHRGNPESFPENTLPGFQDAIDAGADWVELDVHRTADGHLVVCHDATTGRTADQNLIIAHARLAQLRRLDFAYAFRACGDTSPRLEIPLLGEVLDLIQSQAATRLSIQPKADCVVDIVSLVGDLHAEIWVGFNDGDVAKLQLARKLMPRAHIFLDTGGSPRPVEEDIAIAKRHSFQSIVMHHSTATAERVTRIADAGLEPGAWTVNELPKMHSLRALGVTRFYTDRPRTFLATPKQ